MASLVGGLVVLTALGVFSMIDRSERSMVLHADARSELANTHNVIQAAFGSLLMPRQDSAGAEDAPVLAPRMILSRDNKGQRFELSLSKVPLPGMVSRQDRGKPMRGVFELRPDSHGTFTLRWRTMAVSGRRPRGAIRSIDLLHRVKELTWQAFDDDLRKMDYRASSINELPAYVELEIKVAGGSYANWLFDVDWTVGDERRIARLDPVDVLSWIPEIALGGAGGPGGVPGDPDDPDAVVGPDGQDTQTDDLTMPDGSGRPVPNRPTSVPDQPTDDANNDGKIDSSAYDDRGQPTTDDDDNRGAGPP